MSTPRTTPSRAFKMARRTSGDLTLNSTTWANVDTGLDMTIAGQVGDVLAYTISGRVDVETVAGFFDVVTVVSAAAVNSFAERAAAPGAVGAIVPAWRTDSTAERQTLSGPAPFYTLVAGDITAAGLVTVRLRYATGTAANLTLKAVAGTPLDVAVQNLGPADPY